MRNFILFLLVCLAIAACGTKGDLYIPEKQYPQSAPADTAP
jgi:predicted small lipoprotein YifL